MEGPLSSARIRNRSFYNPLIDPFPLATTEKGKLVRPHVPLTLSLAASKQELIDSHRIDQARLEQILARDQGRKTVLVIGRSGIMSEDLRGHFTELTEKVLNSVFTMLRRVGVQPEDHFNLTTSATSGIVDRATRETAFRFGLPTIAFVDNWMMETGDYVSPAETTLPAVYQTKEYSKESVAHSDLVLCIGGAEYSMLNDLPQAIAQGKRVVLYLDRTLPTWEKVKGNGGGKEKIGNCVSLMQDDFPKAYELIAPKLQEITGRQWKLSEVRAALTIVSTPEELAQILYEETGHTESLESKLAAEIKPPLAVEKVAGSLFKDATFILSIAGRSQFNNKPNSDAEKAFIQYFVDQLVFYLRQKYAVSPYEVGIIHGMSNYGSDGVFLQRLLTRGFRGLGIVKPEYAEYVDDTSKALSPYVETVETDGPTSEASYRAYSEAYLGQGLGVKSDLMLVFEGNAGVVPHVEAALKAGIPVVIVPLTADPAQSAWYNQKDGTTKHRVTNVGSYFYEKAQAEPEKYANLYISDSADLIAQHIASVIWQRS